MSATVQNVIDASTTDFRQVLSNATPDSTLYITWVDRIHKDCLHTGIYNQLLQSVATINVVSGTSSYTVTTTPDAIRRIQMLYDRTFDRVILPVEMVSFPTKVGDAQSPVQPLSVPVEMLNAETMAQYPKYFRREGVNNVILFPAPQKTAFNGTYEVHYEKQVTDLVATTDVLVLPSDAMDMVVAGVNTYVAQFLHLDTESQFWSQQYEAYKRGVAIA